MALLLFYYFPIKLSPSLSAVILCNYFYLQVVSLYFLTFPFFYTHYPLNEDSSLSPRPVFSTARRIAFNIAKSVYFIIRPFISFTQSISRTSN